MKKVCLALAEWLAEINHPAQHAKFPCKIQIVFPSEADAHHAHREWMYRAMDAMTAGNALADYGGTRYEGITFEFVGPAIIVKR
jgi:hypothetical protein